MPKGNKTKRKKEKTSQEEGATGYLNVPATSFGDDSDSVCSSIPESTLSDEISEGIDESDSSSSSDTELQFQLTERFDLLADKNSRTRISALVYLNDTLKHKMVSQYLSGKIETMIDSITRGLKKVKGQERHELLLLVSLLAVQFGEEYPELWGTLQPVLLSLLHDPTVSINERSSALSTLTLCTFLLCQDIKQVESMMHECELIYSTIKFESIQSNAIRGWTLLLSIIPDHSILAILATQLPQLTAVLESCTDLSLKIATGQAIALLFELAREIDEEILDSDEACLIAAGVVQSIAVESNRYAGRKERSQQRSSFKDISQAIESGAVPRRHIRFGMESLHLNSWAKLVQYNIITELLSTGCRMHLQNNDLLRDIFQLGSPVIVQHESKADKMERKLYNAANAKWRSQQRGKLRDKRAVV